MTVSPMVAATTFALGLLVFLLFFGWLESLWQLKKKGRTP